MSRHDLPPLSGGDRAIDALVMLLLVAIAASLIWVGCGCRALVAPPCLPGLIDGLQGAQDAPPTVDPSALPKPAKAALQRAQSATVCVSTEVTAARQALAADVAPTLPVPAAAIDAHLAKGERAAAELPPAIATLAAAAKPAPPAPDLGDKRIWRWGAALGALAMLGGIATMVLARVWQVGSPRLGAGIAAAGGTVAITSYVWQTWAKVLVWCVGGLALCAVAYGVLLLYAWGRRNWDSLIAALRMDAAIKAGHNRDAAKAAAVAEQSPAVANAIKRAKDVLPLLPPLPPVTPTPLKTEKNP